MTPAVAMPLRILAVADSWLGSNGHAYVQAFRRLGHSVRTVPVEGFIPTEWQTTPLRVIRRAVAPLAVREYNAALVTAARELSPHVFFVFKGRHVTAETIRAIRGLGATAVNLYPDVSFLAHGPHIPRALPEYNWIFHTKTFGLSDLRARLGVGHASFLPHAFDPEVHRPVALDDHDRVTYECDVSFVGTWSPKKQRLLEHLCRSMSSADVRVWGAQWEGATATLGSRVRGRGVHGLEFAKALVASRVNVAILSEARTGASRGDQITSRTFHIPATGAFMLHERTEELLGCFDEDVHCGAFATPDELAARVAHYLTHDDERRRVAEAGFRRVHDGHSVDHRARTVLGWVAGLRAAGS